MRKKVWGFIQNRFGILWCVALLSAVGAVNCPPLAGVQGVDKCSLSEAHPTEICKLLTNKTASEKAQIKSREIAKRDFKGEYTNIQYGVKVEIIGEVKEININGQSGIELFAKAWRGDKQLGFGKDGSVEIERFRIFNPPILVDGTNGDIVREWTDKETGELKQRKLKEYPQEAIRQSLAHTIKIVGKDNNNITVGKVGNTTSTFYPDAGDLGSTSVDGYVQRVSDCSTWSNVRDGVGTAAYAAGTSFSVGLNAAYCSGTWYIMSRAITLFNTSAIGSTSTITSATYSLWNLTKRDELTPAGAMSVVTTNPASNTTLAASDYSQTGDILQAPIITLANITTNAYNDFALNSTGLSNISKNGVTKFGMRLDADRTNTEPTYCNCNSDASFSSADTTGTTQDPKLVVVHSAAVVGTELYSMSLFNDANLRAYYRLENVNDATANGYNLTNNNSVAFNAAKFNNGADFGSANTNKSLTRNDTLGITQDSDKTISFWVKIVTEPESGVWYMFFSLNYGVTGGTYHRITYDNSGGIRTLRFYGLSNRTQTGNLGTTDWHHLVTVKSGSTLKFYLDNTQVGADDSTFTGDYSAFENWLSIGANKNTIENSNYSSVVIDDFAVFNRALTAQEISNIYNGVATPSDTTAPSGSVSINSGASYTNSTTVTLTLSATDSTGVTGYYLSDSSTIPSASASGWTSVTSTTSYSASVSYTLSSGEGSKTIYAWYKDAAGNVSSTANATITLDTTIPTVTISSPTSSSIYTSTSSTMSLGGSASDSVSGISSVSWSNSRGGNGTATGTASWTVSSISLSSGDNVITVTARDGAGNSGTDTLQVTYSTGPTVNAPTVSTGSASNITTSSATLNGTVNANGGTTTAWFQYGSTSGSYSNTSSTQTVTGSSNTTVSIGISGLSSGTTYYYRIAASNSAGTSYGGESSFTTTSAATPTPTPSTGDTTAPTVTITSPTSSATYTTTSSTITLSGTASDNSGSVSSVTWSNSKGGSGTASGTTSWTISSISLSSGDNVITVTAKDGAGNSGTDTITVTYNATTTQPPTVTTGSATNITSSAATLNGTVNANGLSTTAWFEYGITSGSYTNTTSTQSISGSSATSISANISGLASGTQYYYRVVAQSSGGTSHGSEESFTTSSSTTTTPPIVTTDSATNVTTSAATLNGTVNANGLSTTAWFELGISSGTYGGKTSTQGVSGTGNTTVSISISGLASGTKYYYRIAAQNSAGTSYGSENNFTTSSVSTTPTPTPVQTPTPTPTPGKGDGVIYGGVSDEEGNPLKGVTVTITGTDYKDSTETESDGFYEFNELKGGKYTLTYEISGYKTHTESVSLGEGDTVNLGTIALELTVKGSIVGYVVNINDDPIESVKVQLKAIKPKSTKTVFSEQDGSFEFEDLDAGVYLVIARKRSYRKSSERITLGEGEEKEIEIVLRKASKGVIDERQTTEDTGWHR